MIKVKACTKTKRFVRNFAVVILTANMEDVSHFDHLYLSELANAGRPLFPGNDVDDQLKRIFRYPFDITCRYGREQSPTCLGCGT